MKQLKCAGWHFSSYGKIISGFFKTFKFFRIFQNISTFDFFRIFFRIFNFQNFNFLGVFIQKFRIFLKFWIFQNFEIFQDFFRILILLFTKGSWILPKKIKKFLKSISIPTSKKSFKIRQPSNKTEKHLPADSRYIKNF